MSGQNTLTLCTRPLMLSFQILSLLKDTFIQIWSRGAPSIPRGIYRPNFKEQKESIEGLGKTSKEHAIIIRTSIE